MFRPDSASLLRLRLRFFVELDGRADGDGERWLDGLPRGAGDFDPSAELRLGERDPRERGVGGVRPALKPKTSFDRKFELFSPLTAKFLDDVFVPMTTLPLLDGRCVHRTLCRRGRSRWNSTGHVAMVREKSIVPNS